MENTQSTSEPADGFRTSRDALGRGKPVLPRRDFRLALVLAALVLGTASCGRTIMDVPVHRQGDGWDLTVTKITDGPNSFSMGNVNYHPGDGERFVHAHITLRNPAAAPRKFSFDRCDLDAGGTGLPPRDGLVRRAEQRQQPRAGAGRRRDD